MTAGATAKILTSMERSFLFAMPSILAGAGRTLDIGGTFDGYNLSRTPEDDAWPAQLALSLGET